MAQIPDSAEALENHQGASPGLRFRLDNNRVMFALPGVPFEMKHLLEDEVLPYLMENYLEHYIQSRVFRTVGVPESKLAKLLGDLEEELPPQLSLAYNPGWGTLDLRLFLKCDSIQQSEFQYRFEETADEIERLIAEYHFGYKGDTLESVVGEKLRQQNLMIGIAESCTGGALAARLISVAGASDYVEGGIIAYSNAVKQKQLSVRPIILENYGAVSEPVAKQMASGVRDLLGADIGVSTTGIVGPSGGTDQKPVGTVWIGIADENESFARCFHIGKDRERNIERTVVTALHQLWRHLG
jgi:nicotinamide-nucleotide amidase